MGTRLGKNRSGDSLPSLLAIPAGRLRLLLNWLCAGRADYREFQRRRSGHGYRRRRALCVTIWLGAAALMALNPHPQLVVITTLLAIFLSFAILDESS
jgi:hypothetical protein